MEKWYVPRVWFSTRRRRGKDETTSHRPMTTPHAGKPQVSCFRTCGSPGALSSAGAGAPRGGPAPPEDGPGRPDLAHEAEADQEEADDEEQRPLPQRVQVVLKHEDWGQRGAGA